MEKQLNVSSLSAEKPANTTPKEVIDRLIMDAFAPALSRLERSPEYVNGVRALLLQQFIGKPLACLYTPGTAAADAFFAGVEEGRAIYASHVSLGATARRGEFDSFAGLKGHDYIKARNLSPLVKRHVQTSAQSEVAK